MKKALLIIGHGSKAAAVSHTFQQMVEDVRRKSKYTIVEGAHMEFGTPSIEEAVSKIAQQDIQEITIVPYFLYEGIHTQRDIPDIIRKIKTQYQQLKFTLSRPIGFEPIMSELVLNRAEEGTVI